MNQPTTNMMQEEWLKVLGKGMVTIPKQWRDALGIDTGDIVKAKRKGNTVIIEAPQRQSVPYRVYTSEQIKAFLKEDMIPQAFAQKVRRHLSALSRT